MDGVRQVSNAIAHDLRTPITRARTRLEDAALHAESADDLRGRDRARHRGPGRIVGVFQALMRIAEIEAGSRRSSFARFDLAPLLAEVVDLYDAVAEERGIILRLDAPRLGAGVWRQGDAAAGNRQPGGQRGQVLARPRDGAGDRLGIRHRPDPRSTTRGLGSHWRTVKKRPIASTGARPHAAPRDRDLACRWCWQSHNSYPAGGQSSGPACDPVTLPLPEAGRGPPDRRSGFQHDV